jgi:hypothetical protein
MRAPLYLFFLLYLGPVVLLGQDVHVRARVDSTSYLIGDAITVHVEATHPKGATLKLAVGDTVDGFTVLGRSSFVSGSEISSSTLLRIAKYDSGSAVLSPLEILYTIPGDTAYHRANTNPLIFTIHTLAVDTSQAYKDLKPPLSIPFTLAEIAMYLGIIVFLAALVFFGYRYWKRRQQKQVGEVYVPPPRPAHVIALEELRILKEKRLWQQGLVKEFYSEVSEITRRYIENRFKLMALEQTTDEIMAGIKRFQLKPNVESKIETLLQLSDLVKFAKYKPGTSEHEPSLNIAFDVVEATKPVPVKPPVQTEHRAPANVEP